MLRTLIAGVSLSLLVATAGADVKKDRARAKQLYDEGLSHYNLAEYDAAITSWKESYLLTKAPLLLFNIGQAYRLSGDCSKANTFYDTYQREQPDPRNREELEQAVALCKSAPAKPDKSVVTPDKPIVTPDKPIVAPDRPVVIPDKSGVSAVPAVPPPASDPGHGKRVAGMVVGVVGLAVTGGGVYFGLAARSQSSKLDGFKGEWGTEQTAIQSKGKRDAKLAWGLGGAGVAAIVAGGILYYLGGPSSETEGIAIAPTDGGAQLAWGTRF
jgi:tetratricopeptide (TPR) repeat protein